MPPLRSRQAVAAPAHRYLCRSAIVLAAVRALLSARSACRRGSADECIYDRGTNAGAVRAALPTPISGGPSVLVLRGSESCRDGVRTIALAFRPAHSSRALRRHRDRADARIRRGARSDSPQERARTRQAGCRSRSLGRSVPVDADRLAAEVVVAWSSSAARSRGRLFVPRPSLPSCRACCQLSPCRSRFPLRSPTRSWGQP